MSPLTATMPARTRRPGTDTTAIAVLSWSLVAAAVEPAATVVPARWLAACTARTFPRVRPMCSSSTCPGCARP